MKTGVAYKLKALKEYYILKVSIHIHCTSPFYSYFNLITYRSEYAWMINVCYFNTVDDIDTVQMSLDQVAVCQLHGSYL